MLCASKSINIFSNNILYNIPLTSARANNSFIGILCLNTIRDVRSRRDFHVASRLLARALVSVMPGQAANVASLSI